MKNTYILISSLILLSAVACKKDSDGRIEIKSDDGISFILSEKETLESKAGGPASSSFMLMSENGQDTLWMTMRVAPTDNKDLITYTKGVPVTTDNLVEQYDGNIGIAAYKKTASGYESYIPVSSLKHDSESLWNIMDGETKKTYLWPSTDIQFWAWAPKDKITPTFNGSTASFGYSMPNPGADGKDAEGMKDVLFTSTLANLKTDNGNAPLHLEHVLAALKFEIGVTEACTIKSISLKNLYSEATLTYTYGKDETVTWNNLRTPKTYVQVYGDEVSQHLTDDDTQSIGTPAKTFMVIPQTSDKDNTLVLELAYIPAGETEEVIVSKELDQELSDWKAGMTYTYSIDLPGSYEIHFDKKTSYVYFSGGNDDLKLFSTQSIDGYNAKGIAWHLEYWDESESAWSSQRPEWLDFSSESGMGATSGEDLTLTAAAQTPSSGIAVDYKELHSEILRNMPSNTDFDLSKWNPAKGKVMPGRTTANCYVVNAPGTYKFPMVYGNALDENNAALENGNNIYAYAHPSLESATSSYVLKKFVNHADREIIDPWIKNNYSEGGTSTTLIGTDNLNAALLWQDGNTENHPVIKNLAISGDYITFEVDKDNICQSNAVIVLKRGSTIIWSWHIWVTDEALSVNGQITYKDVTYKFMPTNLGQCDMGMSSSDIYAERRCRVRAVQEGSGLTDEIEVIQEPFYGRPTIFTCPYYQFGKKDALVPSNGKSENKDKTVFDIEGNKLTINMSSTSSPIFHNSLSSYSIGNLIQHPNCHSTATGDYRPYNNAYMNLWSMLTQSPTSKWDDNPSTVKTIYDPCPSGYKVPTTNAFAGFTNTNFKWSSSNYGSTYNNDPLVYFPATGLRDFQTGNVSDVEGGGVNVTGRYTTAIPNDNTMRMNRFFFSDSGISTSQNLCRGSVGCTIRPVVDDN